MIVDRSVILWGGGYILGVSHIVLEKGGEYILRSISVAYSCAWKRRDIMGGRGIFWEGRE